MNARLDLDAIAAHLRAALSGVKVGTGYDKDYLTAFGKEYPAAWLGAQRLTRMDDGRGYTGEYRQHCRCELAIRLVVQRYAKGQTNVQTALDALHNAVSAALLNYKPAGAAEPFVWESSTDGDQSETVVTADLVFSATVTYASATP